MRVVAVACSLVLTLLAVIVGMGKVQRLPASLQVRDQARITPTLWTVSGWIELAAAAALVVGIFVSLEMAVVGAGVLFVSYLALAVRQLTTKQAIPSVVPALALSVLSAITVASIVASG
ncbi:MAG TPA: hypothetical protein VFX15_04140 [Actinomycetes bacterium]|nr:hypothetical protein [Actinomycetes bacterium]